MISSEIQDQVIAKLHECENLTRERFVDHRPQFDTLHDKLTVRFDAKGQKAGYVQTMSDYMGRTTTVYPVIHLNPEILLNQVDSFIDRTVPHEYAHLIDAIVYPNRFVGKRKRSPHGKTWQSIMRTYGLKPTARHSYDMAGVKTRKQPRYIWENEHGEEMPLTKRKHDKQMLSPCYYVPKHRSKSYTFTGEIR